MFRKQNLFMEKGVSASLVAVIVIIGLFAYLLTANQFSSFTAASVAKTPAENPYRA